MLPFHFKLLKNWEFFPFLTERRIEGGGRGCLLTSLCLLYKLQREVKRQLPERSGKFSLARGVEKKKGRKFVELDAAFRRRKKQQLRKERRYFFARMRWRQGRCKQLIALLSFPSLNFSECVGTFVAISCLMPFGCNNAKRGKRQPGPLGPP